MAPEYRLYSGRRLVLPLLALLAVSLQVTSECDRTFVSRVGGPQSGNFTAPSFLNPEGHSRQCIYTFLAGPHQRVELVFVTFNLRGTPPDGTAAGVLPACIHEYMDVYAEVQQPEASELINSPFGGRYCGPIPPRRRISLYKALALGFYTDKNASTPDLFTGRFSFINDSEYEIGTPVPNTPCSFTVHAGSRRQGVIVSPTYPGTYPKDLTCNYQFLGDPSQRVRLEFRDFDLFFGGAHCPFDYVKVYDGRDNESAVIGTYCGQQRNLVIYSSENFLFVTFFTLQRTANTQNRGFKGIFEFSESFVKLDFIGKNDGEHIRGSECDQQILSKKKSSGYVFSPNYPFPYLPKIVCRYFIYGMQDSQHLERVQLEFMKFKIPKVGERGDCTDGYLKVYLKGQEATDSYDKFDYEMCGDESKPSVVVSDGPRLVMVFSSGELQGQGFKAKYTFETDYKIPGTAAPDGSCIFTYRSSSRKKGEFNSPRYPSNYPSETNCTYLFFATPNEQVTLVFDHFKVRAEAANTTHGSYGVTCQEDWLEMYNMYRDGTEKLIGRYCGATAPGPVESNRGAIGVKILLHSDQEGVYSGFKARYTFEVAKSIFGDCGSNVSSLEHGEIRSPNFPQNYDSPAKGLASKTCNWYINVRPKYKILLNFEMFAVEGDPASRGCPAAVVRLWHRANEPPVELCGEKTSLDKWQFMSDGSSVRLSFISADKSVGAQGFRAVWTEVKEGPDCGEQFKCEKTSYCIADSLRCNRVANCGADDRSDEINCLVEAPVDSFMLVGVVLCVAGGLVLGVCIWCHRKRRRRRHHLPRLHRGGSSVAGSGRSRQLSNSRRQHVCDELGERFASVDSV